MGMFDRVRVDVPLPDGRDFNGHHWNWLQTKQLENALEYYAIDEDRQLYLLDSDGNGGWVAIEQVHFDGEMYLIGSSGPDNENMKFHQYVATFDNGRLVEIRMSDN